VIETAPVVNSGNTTAAIETTAPFDAQPQQYDIYAFGEAGNNVKTFRCPKIERKSDQQFTIYGLEYNEGIYADETPVLSGAGDTPPVIDASNLVADETFDLVGERWVDFLRLGWRPGGLAVGADIYASINGGVEKFVATVRNGSSYLMQTVVGQTVLARVVGFDVHGTRANYLAAPTVTLTMTGVTTNMLINSTFQGSLMRWDVNWRAGDSVQRQLDSDGDGQVKYNVAGSTLTTAQTVLTQLGIDSSLWAVGDWIMASFYVTVGSGASHGILKIRVRFNGAGTFVENGWNVGTATPGGKLRINTAATQVPVGTTSIDVLVVLDPDGTGVSIPVGTTLLVDHLLLETVASGAVTTPSKWADLDNGTTAQNTLGSGDASALASTGSVPPVVSGQFSIVVTDTQATVSWTNYKLKWGAGPTGFITNIQDDSLVITGLTGSQAYTELPYYDIGTSGAIKFAEGFTNSHGSPAGAYNPNVSTDAVQNQMLKGHVPLGSVNFTMNAPGNTSGTSSSDGGSGGRIIGNHGFPQ